MNTKSLEDVHESVDTRNLSKINKAFKFLGPALLVSIGYMDPGNWATDLEAGSRFGYKLLFILLLSNIMALILQSLSARLGIVRGRDLAQINREMYPKKMNFMLYILAEIAIIATDLAEVLGMALGLKLLFGIDLIYGVLITFINTFILIYLQKKGMRKMEAFILGLIILIAGSFIFQLLLSGPNAGDVVKGLVPKKLSTEELYIAIGIIGATVMPHNLYLHSALVQSRKIGEGLPEVKYALKWNFIDSFLSLNVAFFINASILILAASSFHVNGYTTLSSITDAHKMLNPVLGSEFASVAFALALIAAGQSSTVTGTLAGQIVMEGYLNLRLNPVFRQLITRLLAILPAVTVIILFGEGNSEKLLVFSQVILSLQLSFVVIPLIISVSSTQMKHFKIKKGIRALAWLVATIICSLNVYWLLSLVIENFSAAPLYLKALQIFGITGFLVMIVLTVYYPYRRKSD